MKTILVVVWFLSSGQLVGERWHTYPNYDECDRAANYLRSTEGRLLFFSGCLDEKLAHNYTAYRLDLKPSEEKP